MHTKKNKKLEINDISEKSFIYTYTTRYPGIIRYSLLVKILLEIFQLLMLLRKRKTFFQSSKKLQLLELVLENLRAMSDYLLLAFGKLIVDLKIWEKD